MSPNDPPVAPAAPLSFLRSTIFQADALPGALRARGWEEVGSLGSGALGPVLLVQRPRSPSPSSPSYPSSSPLRSALKRSTAVEVRALLELAQGGCRGVVALQEHFHGDSPGNQVWARLELFEGGTLRTYLRAANGQTPEDVKRAILSDVLRALENMHQLGWMHRDVKAENIGFTANPEIDGYAKLMDFDVATPLPAQGERLTEIVGTVENMAPEVFEGAYDERADCWSVGVVAYELLAGYRPFNDASIERVEEMVRNWHRYLIVPSDFAAVPSDFVRGLLTACDDRVSIREASRHPWLLCGGGASVDDALPRRRHYVEPAVVLPHAPAAPAATQYCHQVSATRRVKRLAKVVQNSDTQGDGVGEGDVEQLARMRVGLTEWNQSFDGGSTDQLARRWSLPARVGRSQESVIGVDTPQADATALRFDSEPGAGCSDMPRRIRAAELGASNPRSFARPSDDVPMVFLEETRTRTKALLWAAEQMVAAHEQYKHGADTQHADSMRTQRTEEAAPEEEADTGDTAAADEETLAHLENTRVKTQDLLNRMAAASLEASQPEQRCDEGAGASRGQNEVAPPELNEADVYAFLDDARVRTRDLVHNLEMQMQMQTQMLALGKEVSDETAAPLQAESMEEAVEHGQSEVDACPVEPPPPASPRSWLASQRKLTAGLLEHFQNAAALAQIEGPSLDSDDGADTESLTTTDAKISAAHVDNSRNASLPTFKSVSTS